MCIVQATGLQKGSKKTYDNQGTIAKYEAKSYCCFVDIFRVFLIPFTEVIEGIIHSTSFSLQPTNAPNKSVCLLLECLFGLMRCNIGPFAI